MTAGNTLSRRPLTELQQRILDLIWSKGSATSDHVREGLRPGHTLSDSTIRTLLRRLEARGYLTHTLDGKSFVYRAAIAPRGVAARTVRQLIDRFWAGSAEQFLAGMVDEQVLDVREIERLANKVRRANGLTGSLAKGGRR